MSSPSNSGVMRNGNCAMRAIHSRRDRGCQSLRRPVTTYKSQVPLLVRASIEEKGAACSALIESSARAHALEYPSFLRSSLTNGERRMIPQTNGGSSGAVAGPAASRFVRALFQLMLLLPAPRQDARAEPSGHRARSLGTRGHRRCRRPPSKSSRSRFFKALLLLLLLLRRVCREVRARTRTLAEKLLISYAILPSSKWKGAD